MSLTNRQQGILEKVCDVEAHTKRSGQQGYSLKGEDVTTAIHSLMVRDLVSKEAGGRRILLTKAGQSALGVFAT